MIYQYYPQVNHAYAFELNKDFTFSAAHLIDSESAGKCRNLHGHNYTVNITVVGDTVDESGFLVNFSELKNIVHGSFDHTNLCDSMLFDEHFQPSTENLAKIIFEMINSYLMDLPQQARCLQVIVRETPTSYVVYRGSLNGFFN